MEREPLNKTELDLALALEREKERKESDGRYAPMIVKTILYGLLATLAGGVVIGMGDLVSKAFIRNIEEKTQTLPVQQLPAAAASAIYDLPQ